jgi:hypothetical protein
MISRCVVVSLALLASTVGGAQAPAQFVSSAAPVREVVAVFISMADCCDALTRDLRAPVDSVRSILKRRALRANESFRMVGVSLDWEPEVGWNYLRQFGAFDEVAVGSNWFGLHPEVLLFSGAEIEASIPQIVLYERTVALGSGKPSFSPRRMLRALRGRDQIVAWLNAGAPLP